MYMMLVHPTLLLCSRLVSLHPYCLFSLCRFLNLFLCMFACLHVEQARDSYFIFLSVSISIIFCFSFVPAIRRSLSSLRSYIRSFTLLFRPFKCGTVLTLTHNTFACLLARLLVRSRIHVGCFSITRYVYLESIYLTISFHSFYSVKRMKSGHTIYFLSV